MSDSKKKIVTLFTVVAVVLVIIIGYLFYKKNNVPPVINSPVTQSEFRSTLQDSVGGKDPKPLQEFFVKKIKSGVNDNETKSAIYWITHRYFDNGGDIYEIYNFVNSHPEVAFLKEAEKIYPTSFEKIKTSKVEPFSADSVLALLAYYEAIDSHGYASLAVWGIAANKYSEFAYMANKAYLKNPTKQYAEGEVSLRRSRGEMIEKAMFFINKAQEYLIVYTPETHTLADLNKVNIIPDDLLVGLNQYASAVENLKSVGMNIYTPFEPAAIYEFNTTLASTKVPRLYFFTNYLYATSLVYAGEATKENVKVPLSRALEYVAKTAPTNRSKSVSRVIMSKVNKETSLYNYEVTKKLASLNGDFKYWLQQNGWSDADF